MSENYCPSCGLQKSYGRTLAYYPDGPDLNKNICSKCGQTLMSADATIATLQAQVAQLRAALELVSSDRWADPGYLRDYARAALAQTPTEALARWNAMARVCEAAKEVREICHNVVGKTPEEEASNRAINRHSKYPTPNTHRNICAALRDKLDATLAALRSLDTKVGA